MKRKLKSMLAGLLCLACLPVMPLETAAVDTPAYDLIILGKSEGSYVALTKNNDTVFVSADQITPGLPEGVGELAIGDVVRFSEEVGGSKTDMAGNNVNILYIGLYDNSMGYLERYPLEPGMVYKVDSVLDDMETAVYTAGSETYGLELSDGENEYCMITSWLYYKYYNFERLGNIDWQDVEPGDTLECIVYDGRPVIALEVVSTTLNEDGESDYDYEDWREYRSVYRLFTNTFKYTNRGWHTEKNLTSDVYYENGLLRSDAVNANCLVTGVYYAPGETKPAYYTFNQINDNSNSAYFGFSGNVAVSEIEQYIGDRVLAIGDLLYLDYTYRTGSTPEDVKFKHMEDFDVEASVEYIGNGMELFGEDFKKVLRHELNKAPVLREGRENYYANTANNIFEKGYITDDDEISLLDVVALNKNLMIGYDIGYIGRLSADVNNDGKLTPTDSLNILKYCVGVIDSFEEIQ